MRTKRIANRLLVGAALLGVVLGAGSARADVGPCSLKVDNFVLFVDQSGSMYQTNESGVVKETFVKDLLVKMNADIPQGPCPGCPLRGGLYLFAPFEEVKWMGPFYKDQMERRIGWIPDGQSVSLRLTPMGSGIEDLAGVVGAQHGKTAVIMFSDGGWNTGADPVEATRQLVTAHPDVTVNVVSIADTPGGQDVNKQVAQAGHGLYAEGSELMSNGAKLDGFVRDVFCGAAPVKRRIVLRGVNFEFDKSTITAEGKPVLDEAIRTLKEESSAQVSVEGHTDSVGSDAYNQALSERRAHAVVDYLAAGGIARKRLSAVGFGEKKPVASNDTEDGRAQNRRVEFRILSQ
jgi:OOP family OmpA-OmpF porin